MERNLVHLLSFSVHSKFLGRFLLSGIRTKSILFHHFVAQFIWGFLASSFRQTQYQCMHSNFPKAALAADGICFLIILFTIL